MGNRRKRQVQIQIDIEAKKAIRALRQLGASDKKIMREMKKNTEAAASSWENLRKAMRRNYRTIQSVQGAMDVSSRVFGKVQAAMSGVVASMRAAAEQRTGILQMQAAMRGMGISATGAAAAIEILAARQQDLTRFGDDATRSIAAGFATAATGAELSATQIVDSVRLIQDIAERTGRSAEELSVQLAALYGGNFEAINSLLPAQAAYIQSLRETSGEANALEAALVALNAAYGGAAQEIDEFDQFMAETQNTFGDMTEQIGEGFTFMASGLGLLATGEGWNILARAMEGTQDNFVRLRGAIEEAISAAQGIPGGELLIGDQLWSLEALQAMRDSATNLEMNAAGYENLTRKLLEAAEAMRKYRNELPAQQESEALLAETRTLAAQAAASGVDPDLVAILAMEAEFYLDLEQRRNTLARLRVETGIAQGARSPRSRDRGRGGRGGGGGGGGGGDTRPFTFEMSSFWGDVRADFIGQAREATAGFGDAMRDAMGSTVKNALIQGLEVDPDLLASLGIGLGDRVGKGVGEGIGFGVADGMQIATSAIQGFTSTIPAMMEDSATSGVEKFGAVMQFLGVAASAAASIGVATKAATSWAPLLSDFFSLAAASAAFAAALGAGGGAGAPPERGASGTDTGDILTGVRPEAARTGQARIVHLSIGTVMNNDQSRRDIAAAVTEAEMLGELRRAG
jgi:hypothetical protein